MTIFNGKIHYKWGLSKIMVPENCPYAALSRTFRALSRPSRIGTWDNDQVFVCKFVTKIYRRIVFKNITDWRSVFKAALVAFLLCVMSLFQSTESMAFCKSVFLCGRLTSGHWFCTHSLKSFWSCDNAERTSPFWARVGSGRIHLSRTFRGPFANLSRISRLKNEISETNVYARVSFIIYANHAGCHCQLSEHGTIRNMNPVAILHYNYIYNIYL